MRHLPNWHRSPDRTIILLSGIALLLLIVEHINGRFWLNDFRVYYGAAQALLNGTPLYGVAYGLDSGVFKYAPAMALLYTPLALLPYGVAATIQYLGITAAFIAALILADRILRERLLGGKPSLHAVLLLTALVGIVHLHRELHLGNINAMLLCLLLLTLNALLQGREKAAGLLLGLAILAKPHFAVLLPLLVLHGRYRVLTITTVVVLAGLLAPALLVGLDGNATLLGQWLDVMREHNSALIYTAGDDHRAVNTVYSFLHRALLHLFMEPSAMEAYLLLGIIALAFGAFVLWNKLRKVPEAFPFEFLLLLALVPSITLTDTEHFLFALPLVAWTMHHLLPKAGARWLPLVAIPLLFGYGGNWEDALGPLSDRMVQAGVLGIANAGLLLLGVVLFARRGSNESTSTTS
ncbi:MAG: DUF2029 domain-containing protein [Flavobacteriales bacterium]|nr:DUF2029 domain-containing protein [Flavobacteriales bacterium]